jgi:hypothetical protein
VDQPQERLVDEGGGVEHVAATAPPELASRDAPQPVVHDLEQPFERRRVTLPARDELLRDVSAHGRLPARLPGRRPTPPRF